MKGLFITIEGADGSGKTTQIELLKKYFEKKSQLVIFTREPGGTVISEAIREIILDKRYMEMSDTTESLLYAAARAQHVEQLIKPALQEGKIIICDRYVDSSIVYQGIARGIGIDEIIMINNYAIRGLQPDLTIILDLDEDTSINRKNKQKELDRLELQKVEFHKKVVEGYRLLANKYSDRICLIDAAQSIENIHQKIIKVIEEL